MNVFSRGLCSAAFVVCCLLSLHPLAAQTSFGRVSGSITDQTGAAVPAAKVVITNTETGNARSAEADQNGFYVLTNLPIGPYRIEVNQTGFQRAQQNGLEIIADGRLTLDFKLQVGDISQSVEVTALQTTETLNTVSGELARVIDTRQVENLALNGSNYVQLMTLVPGAVVTNPDQFSVTTSLSATNQNINGNRGDSQNLTVDGAFNLVAGSNGSLMNNVNPNFIQEVKIQTSNANAEYGRTAGVTYNIVTKNGTNTFHGSAFETFRNDALDARNFFSVQKTKLRYNDFGFTVGGPIKKDKLFFFYGQEWKRLRQTASPSRQTVPTTAMLNGNFAGQAQLFYPGTKDPIPNNDISSLITADGRALAKVYLGQEKLASFFNDANVANNVTLQPENPLNYRQHLIRIDYHMSDKSTLYGRWVSDRNSLVDPYGTFSNSNLPTTPTLRGRPGESFLMSHTWLATPSIVNEFRTNASWASQNIPPYGDTWQRSSYGFTFPYLFPAGTGNYRNGIPDVTLNGFANFKGPSFALHSPSTDIQVADSVSWIHGSHIVRAGVAIIRDRVDQNGRSAYTGSLNFQTSGNSNTTGNAVADMLMGNFRTYTEASADPMGFFRFWQPGAFVQDSIKVTRTLGLEVGLRWERLSPWSTDANNMANFVPALYNPAQAVTINSAGRVVPGSGNLYNGLIRAGDGIPSDQIGRVPGANSSLFSQIPAGAPRGFFDSQNTFSPRIGFAWSALSKTVIRGGFGMFYARPQGNMIFSQLNVPPITQVSQFENGNLANPGGAAGVLAPNGAISAIDPNVKNGYSEQFSFGIQRELPKSILAEVSYVGNLGRHLLRQPNINQIPFALNVANAALPTAQQLPSAALYPYKGFTNITQYRSDSTSNYHALQAYAARRMGNVTFTVSYTFSKALGDSSGQGDNPENYLDRHYNYGPLSFDRRHAFVATYVWYLPRLGTWNVVARNVLGSWQLNGIIRLQTGQYFTPTATTSIGSRRADYLGGPIYPTSGQDINNWINKAAFGPAANDRFGNAGPGSIEGPGLQSYDLSVAKNFRMKERMNLKFQADFFNAFNVANFTSLNVTASDKAFGTLTSAYPPRNLQMQLKFSF
ncbi:MAG TPA: TonB-dependent receptor [Candidatus Acidoferrum sp.]|nr:TonB-dependent receptor [Candidatus Acidoferrum sp.]